MDRQRKKDAKGPRAGRGRLGFRLSKRAGAAYEGAIEAVVAFLIGAGFGYWVDQKLGSFPLWFLVGLALGFGAFVVRLLRLRSLLEAPPDDEGRSDS